jgi:hypothetical protein
MGDRVCKHCHHPDRGFAEMINHYIQEQGYRLLHVGQDTQHAPESGLWHNTIAVLGTEVLPLRTTGKIEIITDLWTKGAGE